MGLDLVIFTIVIGADKQKGKNKDDNGKKHNNDTGKPSMV